MANEKQTPTPDVTAAAVMDRMADVLEQLQQNAPPQEIGYGDPRYQQRLRDEGFMDEFPIPVYQNGREAAPRGLSAQTRERASSLTAGKYLGGKVEVAVDGKGRVHLLYKSASVEDRMRFASVVTDFTDLVNKIWAEMHPGAAA